MKNKKWIALFSQTGSELLSICNTLGRWPDAIITNTRANVDLSAFKCKNIARVNGIKYNDNFYDAIINAFGIGANNCIITCHGWLRIIPPATCSKYTIYNGHPGDVVRYPELKGKDPQQKAFDMKLTHSGSIIHRVTAEVDDGPIVSRTTLRIIGLKTVDAVVDAIKKQSIKQWISFLNNL